MNKTKLYCFTCDEGHRTLCTHVFDAVIDDAGDICYHDDIFDTDVRVPNDKIKNPQVKYRDDKTPYFIYMYSFSPDKESACTRMFVHAKDLYEEAMKKATIFGHMADDILEEIKEIKEQKESNDTEEE